MKLIHYLLTMVLMVASAMPIVCSGQQRQRGWCLQDPKHQQHNYVLSQILFKLKDAHHYRCHRT